MDPATGSSRPCEQRPAVLKAESDSPQPTQSQRVTEDGLQGSAGNSAERQDTFDTDLHRLIEAWSILPAPVRDSILALVESLVHGQYSASSVDHQ